MSVCGRERNTPPAEESQHLRGRVLGLVSGSILFDVSFQSDGGELARWPLRSGVFGLTRVCLILRDSIPFSPGGPGRPSRLFSEKGLLPVRYFCLLAAGGVQESQLLSCLVCFSLRSCVFFLLFFGRLAPTERAFPG